MPDDPHMATRYERIRAQIEMIAGEPIRAFGAFATPGFVYSGRRREVEPGGRTWWHRLSGRRARRRGEALPLQCYLALTDTRLLAVEMETAWRSPRVGQPTELARAWERSATSVEVTEDHEGAIVHLVDERDETRLQSADLGRELNDRLLDVLRGG